jgi:hypothetical protein
MAWVGSTAVATSTKAPGLTKIPGAAAAKAVVVESTGGNSVAPEANVADSTWAITSTNTGALISGVLLLINDCG